MVSPLLTPPDSPHLPLKSKSTALHSLSCRKTNKYLKKKQ